MYCYIDTNLLTSIVLDTSEKAVMLDYQFYLHGHASSVLEYSRVACARKTEGGIEQCYIKNEDSSGRTKTACQSRILIYNNNL